MTASPHYNRAPIVEGVIDLRISYNQPPTIEQLRDFVVSLQNEFPKSEAIKIFAVNIPASVAGSAVPLNAPESGILGFKLTDSSERRILQIRTDGFMFSRLAPYSCWDDFRQDARCFWEKYLSSFPIQQITRVAVRYINRIEIPDSLVEPEDYFNLYPHTPKGTVIQDVARFALQLTSFQKDLEAIAQIQQTLVSPSTPGHIAILLDIDVFSEKHFDVSKEDEAWLYLDLLRLRKNAVFESAITDKTRELIK